MAGLESIVVRVYLAAQVMTLVDFTLANKTNDSDKQSSMLSGSSPAHKGHESPVERILTLE